MDGLFNTELWINVIHYNRIKEKILMIISIKAKQWLDKILHLLMIKSFRKLRIEGNFLNLGSYSKLMTYIGSRHRCLLSPLLINIILKVLISAIKKNRQYTYWTGRSKVVMIHRWQSCTCKKSKAAHRYIWIKEYSKVAGDNNMENK